MPEQVPCNLCGSSQLALQRDKMVFLGIPEGLGIVECVRCGLVFMSPRPTEDEYQRFYSTSDFYHSRPIQRERAAGLPSIIAGLRKSKGSQGPRVRS